jgi:hypothetical protein
MDSCDQCKEKCRGIFKIYKYLDLYGSRITEYGYYNQYHCSKYGKDIEIYNRTEKDKPENTGYYHDGGWYRDNE